MCEKKLLERKTQIQHFFVRKLITGFDNIVFMTHKNFKALRQYIF